ncbi:efflux RND transporter periplasmic adaptor subunit [Azospirillum halopraeferens]|uniref:efflux RND transporter periplasmic adaptor subunit n=1 Tax=Azospirillum halopraeferens TaxID=34010 RepID=UPI00040C6811|nr:efflux RND transporter periplasmic adaptor subunit [Azospirillum halopraeferens]
MARPVRILFPLVILLAAAAAGGTALWWSALPPVVRLAGVERGPAVEAVYATGTVEPVHWARVESLVSARIEEVLVRDGEAVRRGQLLARLDDAEAQAHLRELEARARFLQSEVDRQQELSRRGVASAAAYERAVSELAQVRAAIGAQREALARYELVAPIDGVVLRRDAEIGDIVRTAASRVLFTVGRTVPLWAVVEVDEEDMPRVRTGLTALIKADAFPGRALDGRVGEFTPMGDPVNKSYRVRIALPDDTPLLIGMTVEANIITRRADDALLVPEGAVAAGRVFVIEDGVARARSVEVGVVGNGRAEIRAGLSGDERVVAAPPAGLADGMPVRLRES